MICTATISEITEFQRAFDDAHGWRYSQERKIDDLQLGTVCLAGEVGEFANVLKKIVRHSRRGMPTDELWHGLKEELTDVFIYLIKLADLLGMKLDDAYFEKMAKNEQRFKKFEINVK